MSICETCQGKGFIEYEHGLIMVFCDCKKGRELRAEVTGPPTEETLVEVAAEANVLADTLMPRLEGEEGLPVADLSSITTREEANKIGSEMLGRVASQGEINDNSSDSRIDNDNQPAAKSLKPKKRKRKLKKA